MHRGSSGCLYLSRCEQKKGSQWRYGLAGLFWVFFHPHDSHGFRASVTPDQERMQHGLCLKVAPALCNWSAHAPWSQGLWNEFWTCFAAHILGMVLSCFLFSALAFQEALIAIAERHALVEKGTFIEVCSQEKRLTKFAPPLRLHWNYGALAC